MRRQKYEVKSLKSKRLTDLRSEGEQGETLDKDFLLRRGIDSLVMIIARESNRFQRQRPPKRISIE